MAPSGTREAAANGTKDVGVNAKVSVERDRERRPEEAQKPWRSRISPRGWAAIGTGAVLAASPALELLTGDATLYSLPPLVLLAVFWNRTGLGRREVGFVSGRGSYQTAILHPLLVVGGIVFLATAVGVTRVDDTPVRTVALQVSMMTAVTALGALITEDGFFRGWLWATLERSRLAPEAILMWTAFAFAAWHLPVALIEPSFRLPVQQLPVHMLNVWLLGMSWGVLRLVSGSVLVAAISHGLWNGLAYTLFGFGTASGALGIATSLQYDPERGWAGVAFNTAAFLFLWRWWQRLERARLAADAEEAANASG
jgi:membrane protease YdiL (CAAX protease family)